MAKINIVSIIIMDKPITKKTLQENRTFFREEQERKLIQMWTQRICAEVVQKSKISDSKVYTWKNATDKAESIVPAALTDKLVTSLKACLLECKVQYIAPELTVDWS